MRADLDSARRQADFVLVSIHWGRQLQQSPDRTQRRLGHLLCDWGADAVIGHHPHVLQGIEVYRGKVIAYSLGDFVNLSSRKETAVLQLAVRRAHETESALVIPMELTQGQVRYATGKGWKTTLAHLNRLSADWGTRIDAFGGISLR